MRLPQGEDLNEWLACNTVDFFNEISLLYGTCQQFCTPETCPVMNAGMCVYLDRMRTVFILVCALVRNDGCSAPVCEATQ